MYARALPFSLRHTGGKGQTKDEGAGRPEGAVAAAANAARHDGRGPGCFLPAAAAEPSLSPRPQPRRRPPTAARAAARPSPHTRARAGRERARGVRAGGRAGGQAGGRAASAARLRPGGPGPPPPGPHHSGLNISDRKRETERHHSSEASTSVNLGCLQAKPDALSSSRDCRTRSHHY
ncbi:spidroin-2-like isoform X2 [Erinaceus europaeus]|uniref:Spidroin-2-like isoform X2 n=1 Tax=Erinaceus europaeus TaxID=9365 RepID=A0ABM3Y7G9_ERIEU|nr:spidroin-2-like isoform X2 [Erinaceus europaeus]